ncbi:MAG: hypothetical protein K9N46_09595 [Candidatus Marinimicrobia bacterium]|nr:hypothetical protein [Candidatus Neomarinimicrobiota bacterium]MCF7828428.1 hypothetical protein [Candidatus Neomarinimicrobiota bacterium]MCF7880978.1 hypothetical protein [Candidatus Neomarinimicrobiota bacterium]
MNKSLKFLLAVFVMGLALNLTAQESPAKQRIYSLGWLASPDFHYLPWYSDQQGSHQATGGSFIVATITKRQNLADSFFRIYPIHNEVSWFTGQILRRDTDKTYWGLNVESVGYENYRQSKNGGFAPPIISYYKVFLGSYYSGSRPQYRNSNRDDYRQSFYADVGIGLYLPKMNGSLTRGDLTVDVGVYLSGLPFVFAPTFGSIRYGAMGQVLTTARWNNFVVSATFLTRYTLRYGTLKEDAWSNYQYPATITVGFLFN